MSNTAAAESIPSKIGKYDILSKIGEGGFGIVYKGRDPFIKRTVAVKTCTSDQEVVRKRFFREAEIAGNLRHDNVVTIHDFGVHEETPFLVQEFLSGEDLEVLIESGYDGLDMSFKVRCLREVAEGLCYAHQQGVIHRDIKPANIRVLQDGRIKVMDFGIARLKDQQTQLTKTGMTLGTVSYLSPEQLRGDAVDHRVDIFSYGVLAYELLCRKKPFSAKSISNLFYKLLHEEAPPLTAGDLPPGLGAMVKRCLEKSADDRYPSFAEAIDALHEIQVAAGILGDPSSFPGQGMPDVVETVREALRAGELTAAEFSLDLARKQMGNSDEFDRRFGALHEQLQELKQSEPRTARNSDSISANDIAVVHQRIRDQEFPQAESQLIALSKGRRGNPQIEELWDDLRQARTGTAGELPIHGDTTGALSGQWWSSRQNQLLAAGIGAAAILLLLIVWFVASSSDSNSDGPTNPNPVEATTTGSGSITTGDQAAAPAPIAADPESLALDPTAEESSEEIEPAAGENTLEEWSGEAEAAGKNEPLEEFSGQ